MEEYLTVGPRKGREDRVPVREEEIGFRMLSG